ncbi:protein-glutamate methylesterase/protein-glutamine glutaminase [Uliginosibacterium sp. H1]|uniref:protein-glutamate methylesterase/protein-glutamine glutaminase n=1 Tax=Uliginosibacterium sp. H1 TaxID=3114757 RepID=UPI002E1870D8|nr:chemotaxis response regulator protein-glutamate methylesterase [Uliginosibacterium sp. H1]
MIRVMVVDDSAVVRQVIQEVLKQHPDIKVIATASDPIFALARMQQEWPDVLVLDVEMPRMDGITFLKQIMQQRPTPTVICSSLTEKGAQITMEALEAGAVAIITKPQLGVSDFLRGNDDELAAAIRAAAASNPRRLQVRQVAPKLSADAILAAPTASKAMARTTERIVAIGVSTGGTQALEVVLPALPRTAPGLAIVQHMPEKFTRSFADRLNTMCQIEVKEAANGDRILPGRALIAPGGRHMMVKRSGAQYLVEVVDGPLVSRHRPSVDVLFRSVAKSAGPNALGIIMTGMGDDGARGMKEMQDAGSLTLAQDEESCVVFGMPKEAIKHGGVKDVVGLDAIPEHIVRYGR